MKPRGFEFNMRELGGSMGDFGTLMPLAVGYLTVCRMDPAGLLVMMGLANVFTGLVFRLPMPIEPMKVLAVMAIAGAWTPEKVYTSAMVMGIVWLVIGATGASKALTRLTPRTVIRGIQLSLGLLLAVEGIRLIGTGWLLGAAAVAVVLLLRGNRYLPASLALVAGGLVVTALQGRFPSGAGISLSLPPLTGPVWREVWPVLRDGGLAQIPLTATNAVIATAALVGEYWPRRRVTAQGLSLSMGVMNIVSPFFGGMPLCHGAGGLAAQRYFGARTGGANIIEGVIEISLGLLLAERIAAIFAAFPMAVVGAMMLLVGVEMFRFARDLRLDRGLVPVAATVAVSILANMAAGFAAGMLVHYAREAARRSGARPPR